MSGTPEKVREFAEALVRAVDEALGMKLDYTPETLPFLDHYMNHCRQTMGGRDDRMKFLRLVAPMVGCYFGEVVRRNHEARWIMPQEDITTWRVEFSRCFLFFNPLGMAVESFLERETEGVPGAFQVSRERRKAVKEVLDNQPSVLERDFYSLTVRWEILDLISSHLMQDRMLRGREPEYVDERAYRLQIEADEAEEPN